MLSVRPIAIDRRAGENDLVTISFRIIFNRMVRHKKSIYRIPLKYWDGKKVRKGYPLYDRINADLLQTAAEINTLLTDLHRDGKLTIQAIDNYISGKDTSRTDIIQFVKDYGQKQVQLGKKSEGTVRGYNKCADKLAKFAGRPKVYFDEINKEFLEAYEQYCIDEGNNIFTRWDVITKFFHKFMKLAKYPTEIHGYDWPRPPKEGSKVYLTLAELDKIADLELTGYEKDVRDHFLLGCYSGLRFSDWTRYEIETTVSGKALKVQAKKNKEPIYLSLERRPRLKAVIDQLGKCSLSLEVSNRLLKLIAAKAGINKSVSTHVARHTCAVLHAELGYSKEFVAQLLGVTLGSVEYYYKITRRKLRNEEELFGGL